MAEWLRGLGITVFLLKYRVIPRTSEHRALLFTSQGRSDLEWELPSILPLDVSDGRAALRYVRSHASEFGIVPTRVGMLGASAGAMLAFSLVVDSSSAEQPDFLALLYTEVFDSMRPFVVPRSAPPLFLAVASDDQQGFARASAEVV